MSHTPCPSRIFHRNVLLTRKVLQRAVSGVRADGHEGEDGEFYTAMGYVARTVRNALQGMGRTKSSEGDLPS